MINAYVTSCHTKYETNNKQQKESIDSDYDGMTIKKAIGNSFRVKRLNKNLWMNTFWETVIKALKKMLASV